MGKRSKRPNRTAQDLHATIREAAERFNKAPVFGVRGADESPEVAELVAAARTAIEATMPTAFEFHGRRYFLRVRLGLQLDIFDTPGAALPLVRGTSFSFEWVGHAPAH